MSQFNSSPMPVEAGPQWHRSYPPNTIGGVRWMLDALDDLVHFAEDRNLQDVATELRSARDTIAPSLRNRR